MDENIDNNIPFLNERKQDYQNSLIGLDITERNGVGSIIKPDTKRALQKSIKEAADYKYPLEESFNVTITDQESIALLNKYLQKTYPCANSVI